MPAQRGEIYLVNLNPVQGREQAGRRPVLILSIDSINRLPLVVTVVVGTKGDNVKRDYPTNVRVTRLRQSMGRGPMTQSHSCVQETSRQTPSRGWSFHGRLATA